MFLFLESRTGKDWCHTRLELYVCTTPSVGSLFYDNLERAHNTDSALRYGVHPSRNLCGREKGGQLGCKRGDMVKMREIIIGVFYCVVTAMYTQLFASDVGIVYRMAFLCRVFMLRAV